MSFKREVVERVGLFDVRLGPGASGFSEDTEFSVRVRKAGFRIGYTPHAVAYHELNPARYGRAYDREAEFRKGLSRSIYRGDSVVFKIIPNLIANYLRLMIYRWIGSWHKAHKTEGRVYKHLGYLAGKIRRVSSQKR
jgi:GT2 family glycosyltransferase